MKSLAITAIFSLAAAFVPIHAQTVEVALLENSGERAPASTRTSEMIIEGVLDGLFESGIIGTNSRPMPGDLSSFQAYVPGAASAEGMVDYVIVVLAEYRETAPVPACRYRLVRVSDGVELARGTVPTPEPASPSSVDIDTACKSVGAAISTACGGFVRGASASRRKYGHEKA